MTTIAMSGDPLGHHRPSFLVEAKEEGAAGEEEHYVSDSDDDDVDRFVFLARQPAPAGASDKDGVQDAMPPRGGGGGGRKRRLREMLLADDPPAAAKEAPLGLVAPRVASSTGEESGSEEPMCSPERGDLFDLGKKNKNHRDHGVEPKEQRAVRDKGSSGGPQHGDVTAEQKTPVAVAAAAAAVGAPRRFLCSMCGRCFGSHQALGGHVHFGHGKKAKDAIAAAAGHEDVAGGGNGDRGVKLGTVGQVAADGNAAHGEDKAAVGNKTVDFAAHHQDVDTRSFLGRNVGNINEEMFAGAANHGGHRGDEVIEEAGGNGSLAVGVGRPHGKVRKTQHRCEVCGKECLSGQALGGHMRKHRKQSPPDGGGKERRRSPELDWIPTQRAAVITGGQPQRERELGWI